MPGILYIIPTPIGNLDDMTVRAVNTMRDVALLACEDTRTTGNLCSRFDIHTARTSFHAHNEHGKTAQLVERMLGGDSIGLVSDAGTPGISDPGYLLVRAAIDAGIEVVALPGPTAFVPALAASGFPSDRFVYEGFLPPKKGRRTRLEQLAEEDRTVVLYESPHRIGKLLAQLVDAFGPDRHAVVSREISKKFETHHRGTVAELNAWAAGEKVRGELVVVIASRKTSDRLHAAADENGDELRAGD
jgi:16S rRNA (cytidine1402-2'-O)-methyltransferase